LEQENSNRFASGEAAGERPAPSAGMAHEEIADSICDAVNRLDEARRMAQREWGTADKRAISIERVWLKARAIFMWAEECAARDRQRQTASAEPGPAGGKE
jgi:hypothetical protein